MKIIIVEDEMRIKEGLAKLIKKFYPDYEVVAMASNGQEGLECIREHMPDLIFTDIRMPVMDGLDMLEYAREEGSTAKAVILSAYTEFQYAQKAMRLNVVDYLVKPIVIGEFMRVMKRVEEEVKKEQKEVPGEMGNLSHILSAFLYGTMEYDVQTERYLANQFGITKGKPLIVLNCYLGKFYYERCGKAKKELNFWLSSREEISCEIIEVERAKSLAVIIYQYNTVGEFERWFQNQILLNEREKSSSILSYGMMAAEYVNDIGRAHQTLLQYMDWNIVLGERVLISYPKITNVQTVFCVYPMGLEKSMKMAVCSSEQYKIEKVMRQFFAYFKNGKLYDPKEVKECFVRFLWSMMSVVKEIKGDVLEGVKQQRVLEEIMAAWSVDELEEVSMNLLEMMRQEEKEPELSLSIMRAKNMIQEFYHIGINLEDIARKLNVSSEYLGTQFRKETGVNFSVYIRDFRISKAKELLIATTLKQYEVAEKVGYSDSKYFGRVFKEVVGLSPAEYRKANK